MKPTNNSDADDVVSILEGCTTLKQLYSGEYHRLIVKAAIKGKLQTNILFSCKLRSVDGVIVTKKQTHTKMKLILFKLCPLLLI